MILWADGFDAYGADEAQMADGLWASSSGDLVTTPVRTGTHSYHLSGNTDGRRVFGGPLVTAGVAAAFFLGALPASDNTTNCFTFADAGNIPQVTIAIDTTGILSAWRGGPGVGDHYNTKLGDTGAPVLTANAWNHVEAKVKIHGSTGTVEVRVNGATVLALSGQNTGSAGETSQVRFDVNGAFTLGYYLDDLVAWDTSGSLNNDFVGDVKVFTDLPNADTADVDWTPLTGSDRYAMIDEVPADGDTSYDESTTAGDKMGVTFPALDAAVAQVLGVILVTKTKKTDAGACTLQVSIDSGGSQDAGAANPITTAYTYRFDVFETDPDTAAPWVPAAAGAAALVLERTV